MDSATSPDPKDITFTYEVNEDAPPSDQPLAFGVYRSSNSSFDPPSAILVNTVTTDSSGTTSARTSGRTPSPSMTPTPCYPTPFTSTSTWSPTLSTRSATPMASTTTPTTGSSSSEWSHMGCFRLVRSREYLTGKPRWPRISYLLTGSIRSSHSTGRPRATCRYPTALATAAGDRLAAQITSAADALVENYGNPGDVVDLDLIGHSRGAVI